MKAVRLRDCKGDELRRAKKLLRLARRLLQEAGESQLAGGLVSLLAEVSEVQERRYPNAATSG